MKKYIVTLTDEERDELRSMIASGKGAARKLAHARILLKADSAKGGSGWEFITRPSMEAGWTWPKSNWAFFPDSVWTGGLTT